MVTTKDNLKSLSDIFVNDVQFIVPDYQRGYSWGQEQLDDLWEDLENISGNRSHYTGMFTFCKSESGERCYSIVDGSDLENTGVKPDIYVKNTFQDRLEGKDPQLDAAIAEVLRELN